MIAGDTEDAAEGGLDSMVESGPTTPVTKVQARRGAWPARGGPVRHVFPVVQNGAIAAY